MYLLRPRLTTIIRALRLLALLAVLLGAAAAHAEPGAPTAGAGYTVYLPITGRPSAPLSSDALIDAAQERGEISAETALIYHVFVAFGDPRLPARYHGDDSQAANREILGELSERFAQLSPQAQATLAPFTIPPYHSGSWWDLRQNGSRAAAAGISPAELRCGQTGDVNEPLFNQWHYYDSPGGTVRVWWQARYPADEARAKSYAADVDAIWLKLAALMRRQPPSDDGETRSCRGGDSRLDVSLLDLPIYPGMTVAYNSGSAATPSYLLLQRTADRGTLIHELMHAFQFAYNLAGSRAEYSWWGEATATWAIEYVDKRLNHEHGYADYMLRAPELPLETFSLQEKQAGYAHQYGAYLLPFFNQIRSGQPDLVRQSWEQFEHFGNSLAAINSLLPGGFGKQWPEFTLRNINRPPVDDYLKNDGMALSAKLKLDQKVELQGAPSVAYTLDGQVQHLAAHNFHFTFADASVRSVVFENPYAGGSMPTAQVRAVYRIEGGQWATEDWTAKPWATFCRDVRADRVSELFIVISNSEWSNRSHVLKPATAPRLQATNVACRGWAVDADFTTVDKGPTWEKTSNVKTKATFERYLPQGERYQVEFYKVASGTAQWTYSGYVGLCSGSKSGSYDARMPGVEHSMTVEAYNITYLPPFVPGSRKYQAIGARTERPYDTVTYTCPNQTFVEPANVEQWLQTDGEGALMQQSISPDGKTLEGTITWTHTLEVGTITYTSKWKMTALPPE